MNENKPCRLALKSSYFYYLFTLFEADQVNEYVFNYLRVSDILYLDIATSCKLTRPYFLIILCKYMCKVLFNNPIIQGNQIDWIIARGIILNTFKLVNFDITHLIKLWSSINTIKDITHIDLSDYSTDDDLSSNNSSSSNNVTLEAQLITITKHCPNLSELILSDTIDVTDESLIQLSINCPNLTIIDFASAPFSCGEYTEVGIKALTTNCIHLHTIRFLFNEYRIKSFYKQLCEVGPICGRYIDTLKVDLDDSYTTIFPLIMTEITTSYTNLKSLTLVGSNEVFDEAECPEQVMLDQALTALNTACPLLERLYMSCIAFTRERAMIISQFIHITHLECALLAEDIVLLSHSLPRLVHLSGIDNGNEDADVIALAQTCPQLESLDVGEIEWLTDLTLIALGEYCPKLTTLRMTAEDQCHMSDVSDAGIQALVRGCPLLTDFGLSKDKLSIECLYDICHYCPRLQRISLPVYDYDTIIYLIQHASSLRRIDWGYSSSDKHKVKHRTRLQATLAQYHWKPLESRARVVHKQYPYWLSALSVYSECRERTDE